MTSRDRSYYRSKAEISGQRSSTRIEVRGQWMESKAHETQELVCILWETNSILLICVSLPQYKHFKLKPQSFACLTQYNDNY